MGQKLERPCRECGQNESMPVSAKQGRICYPCKLDYFARRKERIKEKKVISGDLLRRKWA